MKKLFILLSVLALSVCSCSYDDSAILGEIDSLKSRISALETSMQQLSDYQTIKDKINNGKFIESCTQGSDGSYTIVFSDKTSINVNAKGQDGAAGKDGATPSFKIENESWFVSYDNGANWTKIGSAIDMSLFKAVKVEGDNLKLTLADDTVVVLAIGEKNQFTLNIDEGGIIMSYKNDLSARNRRMEIPFTISGKVSDPRIIVSFEYDEYSLKYNEQMFHSEVVFNEAKDGGVIKLFQPFYCYYENDERCYYLETAEGTMNIVAYNGDGQSSARSKTVNQEVILCQLDGDYDWEYIGINENDVPTFAIPKTGGTFQVNVWRTEYGKNFDTSTMVRPTKFDDLFYAKIKDGDGTVDIDFYDNGYSPNAGGYYSETFNVYFKIAAYTGANTYKKVDFAIGKFHSTGNSSFIYYFPIQVILINDTTLLKTK